jgi:Tfp pilus assembly protein PilX
MQQTGTYRQILIQTPHKQQGAVLAVSLIILLVLTVLGITAMRGVSLQEKMSANAMNRSSAFSASESAAIGAAADPNNLAAALTADHDVTVTVNPYVVSEAKIRFRQVTLAPNNSITLGKGRKAYHFDIEANGRVNAANARARTREGIYQIAPGGL